MKNQTTVQDIVEWLNQQELTAASKHFSGRLIRLIFIPKDSTWEVRTPTSFLYIGADLKEAVRTYNAY